ncbi:MAG: calcium/sodium antiporter [Thermodesulfobacteriota bacterium]
MTLFIQGLLFVLGLIGLFFGGDLLVKGSSRLARSMGISPLIIGLTVVAFGTSSPEFLVSVVAAYKGSSDLVLGNIIGSNISNIGLILGISSLIYPLRVATKLTKLELPIMLFFSLLVYILCFNLVIGRIEGLLLFSILILFLIYGYREAKKEKVVLEKELVEFRKAEYDYKDNNLYKNILYIVIGLLILLIGASLVVNSAILFARNFGVSELIIGLTIVAVGTSLPELATSVVASLKKEHDIVIGNIVGSNIFNIGILGIVSVLKPVHVERQTLFIEFPIMILFTVAILPIIKTNFMIKRLEGAILLVSYFIFIALMLFIKS